MWTMENQKTKNKRLKNMMFTGECEQSTTLNEN